MISVIIPLYNKEKIIERTLRSVLSQDYDDFEVVIVDDGSTDDSLAVVEREYLKIESELGVNVPVNIIKQENGGPSKARNTGILNAQGDWLYFIDADDEMLPGALTHFSSQIMQHSDVDMFIGEIIINECNKKRLPIEYHDGIVENPFKSNFFGRIYQCSGSSIYRRELCPKTMYNEQLRRYEDLEMLFRRYKCGKLCCTHYPVAQVNVEFASASHRRKDISEDFVGHIDFNGKSFWERMCLYQLFLGERPNYPKQCKTLFSSLYRRWDYYFLYQFLIKTKRIWD